MMADFSVAPALAMTVLVWLFFAVACVSTTVVVAAIAMVKVVFDVSDLCFESGDVGFNPLLL